MLLDVEHPVAGRIKVTGLPIKLSKTPGSVRTPAPTVGQDNDEVLVSLGYGDTEIKKLKESQVI